MNGATQLLVDHWEQVLNPDRYIGNDYVSSFVLQLQSSADGTLFATAPAPGRYKIAAWRGFNHWISYVLIRPTKIAPDIRGAAFSAFEPLNRPYVTQILAQAKRAGMTWAELIETALIDFDAGNLQIEVYCQNCPGAMPLDDLEWLIDEAHNQGLKVVVEPGVWARYKGVLDELEAVLEGKPLNPTPWPDNAQKGPDPTDTSIQPALMQSYSAFMLQIAQVAQQHSAEAMIIGDNVSAPDNALLWSQQTQWTALFAQLRQAFSGKLWVGPTWTCPSQAPSYGSFVVLDGYHGFASGDIASVPACTFPLAGSSHPTAEQISDGLAPYVNSWRAFQQQAQTGLPIIYTDLYTLNVDGVNYLGNKVYKLGNQAVQDNQEIVDLFEAFMQAVGQRSKVGLFLWSVSLSQNGFGNSQDPLRQPELVNAIANWWDGDVASFVPCLVSDPPGVIFKDDFEASPCPLEKQDLLMVLGGDWAAGPDSQNLQNGVLHASDTGFANFGDFGNAPWTDYILKWSVRLVSGTNPVGMMQFRITNNGGWNGYGVHVGNGQLRLHKSVQGQDHLLASYNTTGGTQTGIWYQLEADAIGSSITVLLNGQQIIKVTDQNAPLLGGAFSLGVYGGSPGPNLVDFDDIDVEAAGSAAPGVSAGGVVNSASFAGGVSAVPGSIASIFGNYMTQGVAASDGVPLPLLLGGVNVQLNSIPTPLFFTAPNQINVQLPWEVLGQTQASVTVGVDGITLAPQTVQLASVAPGIFTTNAQGSRQGAILIANSDTIAAPVGSILGRNTRPAKRSEYISIYCTGLGDVTNRPASGAATPNRPLSTTVAKAAVTIGGVPATVTFSGLAPGYVGLYQINAQVSANAPTGDAVPVLISIGGASSNMVTMAVQ